MLANLTKSSRKNKKFKVKVFSPAHTKIIHFGAKGYEDYTVHKDEKRKELYYKRHKVNNDPFTAQFWANNLLWNKMTIEDSKKYIENKYHIFII